MTPSRMPARAAESELSLPMFDRMLIAAIVIAGSTGALLAMPSLWIATPLFAGLVWHSARQANE